MSTQNSTTFPHLNKRIRNLNGQRFGRLVAIGYADKNYRGQSQWLCKCDCGALVIISASNLRENGGTKSCGCLHRDRTIEASTTHGEAPRKRQTPEYATYCMAKTRCISITNPAYDRYGGRGIEFRFNSFDEFLQEMGRKPTPKHSIDRIDVNGHYEKGNVRWATPQEQCRNTRRNHYITAFNQTKLLVEWAESSGIGAATIRHRLGAYQWCNDCAVSLPIHGRCEHKT